MKYIVAPWMDVPKTLKDLETYCAYYNEIGKRCNQQGLRFGYHNHAHEFQKVEGQVMYDYMLEHTNPEYVFFQNAKTAGVQYLVAEIEKYSMPVEESVEVSLDYLLNAPFVEKSYTK